MPLSKKKTKKKKKQLNAIQILMYERVNDWINLMGKKEKLPSAENKQYGVVPLANTRQGNSPKKEKEPQIE